MMHRSTKNTMPPTTVPKIAPVERAGALSLPTMEGCSVGACELEGMDDGIELDCTEGVADGCAEGMDEGIELGCTDGVADGCAEGMVDGIELGCRVGWEVGGGAPNGPTSM
jgi:hypothetical protein